MTRPEAREAFNAWTNTETISLSDYYDLLDGADWTYMMSDDHSVWRRGQNEFGKLQSLYKDKPQWKELYDAFQKYIWSDWHQTEDGRPDYDRGRTIPKPERPKIEGFRTGEANGGN